DVKLEQVLSDKPAGTVAYTVPAAGSRVTRGTIIKVYISSGGAVQVPLDLLSHGPTVTDINNYLATLPGGLSAFGSSGHQSGNCGPSDTVTRSAPTPGTFTQPSTTIELFCGG
ncbi:MAG: hypothetical protein RL140_539, partial [Actinomycetota bacterium]